MSTFLVVTHLYFMVNQAVSVFAPWQESSFERGFSVGLMEEVARADGVLSIVVSDKASDMDRYVISGFPDRDIGFNGYVDDGPRSDVAKVLFGKHDVGAIVNNFVAASPPVFGREFSCGCQPFVGDVNHEVNVVDNSKDTHFGPFMPKVNFNVKVRCQLSLISPLKLSHVLARDINLGSSGVSIASGYGKRVVGVFSGVLSYLNGATSQHEAVEQASQTEPAENHLPPSPIGGVTRSVRSLPLGFKVALVVTLWLSAWRLIFRGVDRLDGWTTGGAGEDCAI